MASTKWLIVHTLVGNPNGEDWQAGHILGEDKFGEDVDVERLARVGAIRKATPEEVDIFETKGPGDPKLTGRGDTISQGKEELDAMTVSELKERAKALGMTDIPSRKADLVDAIIEQEAKA